MSKKKQYTFDDWKNGIIYNDFYDHKIPKYIYSQIKDIGHLSSFLYSEGLINIDTFNKIESVQKEVFYKFSDHNSQSHFRLFTSQCEKAPYQKEFLKQKIQNIENSLQEFPDHIKARFYEGEWNNTGIYYQNYIMLQDERIFNNDGGVISWHGISPNPTYLDKDNQSFTVKTGKRYQNTINYLFEYRVLYLFLEKLKKLSSQENVLPEVINLHQKPTREEILKKAHDLKDNGRSVEFTFEYVKSWFLNDFNMTVEDVKKEYNFSLQDKDSFNRFVNKNRL